MKKLLVLIFFFWGYTSVSAQKVYFVYLESDNGLPFYVRTTDKVYSSSSAGYLILPNLADSNYTLFVGFPSTRSKETKFTVAMQGTDHGFSIKQMDGSLNLFDLQNLNSIKPTQDQANSNVIYEARSDAFTRLLSKASDDSSLLSVPIFVKTEPPKKEVKEKVVAAKEVKLNVEEPTSKPEVKSKPEEIKQTNAEITLVDTISKKTDSVEAKPENAIVEVEKKADKTKEEPAPEHTENTRADSIAAIPSTEEYKRSVIKKHSESSTSEGFGLVYLDKNEELVDTIRLLIPNPKIIFSEDDTTRQANKPVMETKKEPVQVDSSKIGNTKSDSTTSKDSVSGSDQKQLASAAMRQKSKCDNQATDNDFFKLRRNMAAKPTDEAMVDEAKKFFKNKCYTTEQIKNLGALFLTSAGKYLFFDAAYMRVSDQEQFASLKSEIKDEYYLRRFKALIGE
jgi:hypothetical protein